MNPGRKVRAYRRTGIAPPASRGFRKKHQAADVHRRVERLELQEQRVERAQEPHVLLY
jgi:hypothetical protein